MASNRWVAIDPDILTHPLVGAGQPVAPADPTRGAYSRMEAWLWIICNASFADHTVNNRGRKMTLKRGDLLGAWAFLAHTFNWSGKTVRAWVEKLIEDNMLARRALEGQQASGAATPEDVEMQKYYGNQATILSIVNYWRFQFDETATCADNKGNQKGNQLGDHKGNQSSELSVSNLADKYVLLQQQGQPIGTPEGQPKGQHITNNNNYPSSSNNYPLSEQSSDELQFSLEDPPVPPKPKRKSAAAYTEQFEIFWGSYPDRTNNSKPAAFAAWEKLSEADQNAVISSMPAFTAYCRKEKELRVIHAERYIKHRRFEAHLPTDGTNKVPWWKDPAQISKLTDERWRSGIEKHAQDFWPVPVLGPPPGSPDCRVPPHIMDELNLLERYDNRGLRRS